MSETRVYLLENSKSKIKHAHKMLKKFQGFYLILESYPDFRTFKIQHCKTKKVHPSLIHSDRLRLCVHNREKMYSRHFVLSTEVESKLKYDRQTRVADGENSAMRERTRNENQLASESDGKTDRSFNQIIGSQTAGRHSSHRRLLSRQREGVTEEIGTTLTSQSAPERSTAISASAQQNIGNDGANAAAEQRKTFRTRIIFPTNRPRQSTGSDRPIATRSSSSDVANSSQATASEDAPLDNTVESRQQAGLGNGWFSIQKILKHLKRGNRMFYQML